jgi:hypothetical protein
VKSSNDTTYAQLVGSAWDGTCWYSYYVGRQGELLGARSLTPGCDTHARLLKQYDDEVGARSMALQALSLHHDQLCNDRHLARYNFATMKLLLENVGKTTVHPEEVPNEGPVQDLSVLGPFMKLSDN